MRRPQMSQTTSNLATVLLLTAILGLTACATEKPADPPPAGASTTTTVSPAPSATALPESLSPAALSTALEKKDFLLIRIENPTPDRIPGTDASVSSDDAAGLTRLVGPDPLRPVVLYCRTTPKSHRAATLLRERGHGRVSILDGGITAWKAAGLPVEP